jgi:adenylate cyclase
MLDAARNAERPCAGSADDLIDWVLRHATAHDDLGTLVSGVAERLVAAGLPIWRASLDLPTIDPIFRAVSHRWWRDRPVSVEVLPHGPGKDTVFQGSVIYHLLSSGLEARRWRLERGEGLAEFDLLRTLRDDGGTDYLLRLVGFGDGSSRVMGVALSIATDRPGGFAREDIALIKRLIPALGLAAYRISAARTTADALASISGRGRRSGCSRARSGAARARRSRQPSSSRICGGSPRSPSGRTLCGSSAGSTSISRRSATP